MSKNKRLNNKGKNPRGRPRKIQRTLTGAIRRRPQPEEETSATNPEPQQQLQTNERYDTTRRLSKYWGGITDLLWEQDTEPRSLQVLWQNTHVEIRDVPQQLPLAEPDNGTMDDRIRGGRRNKVEMADRVLEKIRCDGVLIMIPTLNTSLKMTPTVLTKTMIQFMNNNNSGDHGDYGT